MARVKPYAWLFRVPGRPNCLDVHFLVSMASLMNLFIFKSVHFWRVFPSSRLKSLFHWEPCNVLSYSSSFFHCQVYLGQSVLSAGWFLDQRVSLFVDGIVIPTRRIFHFSLMKSYSTLYDFPVEKEFPASAEGPVSFPFLPRWCSVKLRHRHSSLLSFHPVLCGKSESSLRQLAPLNTVVCLTLRHRSLLSDDFHGIVATPPPFS